MITSRAEFYVHDFAQGTDDGTVHLSLHRAYDSKVFNLQLNLWDAKKLQANLCRVIAAVERNQKSD